MNNLSARFYLTNAITCVWLIFNGATLKAEHAALLHTQNVFKGVFLYVIVVLGMYFCYIKAKDLTIHRVHALNVFERIFMVLLYLFGVMGNSLLAYFGTAYLFGSLEAAPEWFNNANITFNLLAFGYFFAEAYVLSAGAKREPAAWKVKVSNYILPIYSGVAIGLIWNIFVVGGNIVLDPDRPDFVSELIGACFLVLMIVLPFQRLLWFEIFSDSKGWKANLQIAASLLFVMLSAIFPLFF